MTRASPGRVATVVVAPPEEDPGQPRLTDVLLSGSPRIGLAGPGHGRLDARGWRRRGGGERALGTRLLEAATSAGFEAAGVGVGDAIVVADAAASVSGAGPVVVPPGDGAEYLGPLPLSVLPMSEDLLETLGALGLERVRDLAALHRTEVEARFGPPGVRAHRRARGEDDRVVPFASPGEAPGASLELDGAVASTEPLLFALRQLLHRLCGDLAGDGLCAARLTLRLALEGGGTREEDVAPARPTRREGLLHDLCRAALERVSGDGGGLPGAVEALSLRVTERVEAEVRQRDLFDGEAGDPLRAAAVLSRLVARLGEGAVARPAAREDPLPERRDAWRTVETEGDGSAARLREADADAAPVDAEPPLPGVLRRVADPPPVSVECEGGRPVVVRDALGRHEVVAAEGPERLSGRWWEEPHAREYWWACTEAGELLWLVREHRRDGPPRWRLHGWWD